MQRRHSVWKWRCSGTLNGEAFGERLGEWVGAVAVMELYSSHLEGGKLMLARREA